MILVDALSDHYNPEPVIYVARSTSYSIFFATPLFKFKRALQLRLGDALRPLAVLHKHRDADHRQPKAVRKSAARVAPHHAPDLVVVNQLAEQAGLRQPRERAQVDGGFGVPAPREHAAWSGAEGHHVAWAGEVLCMHARGCCGRGECAGGECAVVR